MTIAEAIKVALICKAAPAEINLLTNDKTSLINKMATDFSQSVALLSQDIIHDFSLDAEILLSHVLHVSRSYLFAWPEKELTAVQYEEFLTLIKRRLKGEPVAYIIGHQEFWSLDFVVTPDTLIPRPETELLVELILKNNDPKRMIADLGTGSGAIALAVAHERPHWDIYATDKSIAALHVAKLNAEKLKIKNVFFQEGDWCEALPEKLFDVIVSNPPYIVENDPHLVQDGVCSEPLSALTSGVDGLDDIRKIIFAAKAYLKLNGRLMLEHGYDQAERIRELLINAGYNDVTSYPDLAGILRVTIGKKIN